MDRRYGFGRFAVLMTVAGLNDYQLKGRAEVAYWPPLSALLERKEVSRTPLELIYILREFYSKERFSNRKIIRLERFLTSSLAQELWTSKPGDVARDFVNIWYRLADTMEEKCKNYNLCNEVSRDFTSDGWRDRFFLRGNTYSS